MKHNTLKTLSFVTVASLGILACNPLNKMSKNTDVIEVSATPDPLELHGDSVEVNVTGTFPTKYFHKKAKVTVTPVFKVDSQIVKEFDSMDFQGEKADGEAQVINFEKGGKFDFNVKLPYTPELEYGELYAVAEGSYKTKEKALGEIKIADGTVITPLLVMSDDKPIIGADKFQRITTENLTATVNYLINSPVVRSSELSDADMKQLIADIKARANDSTYVFKALKVDGYASPDGEISLNDNLADDRAKSASNAVKNYLRRYKVSTEDDFYQLQGKGEDWPGFKSEMEKSDIKDKELILRVLQMYEDRAKREQEIKNLAATYVEVADKILPKLRRSEVTLVVDKVGKTDEQITELAANDAAALNVEELLYAATLTNDMNTKLSIYKKVAEIYPEDWRGHNNIGYIYLLQNKLSDAKTQFNKAASIDASNPVVNNNLGVIARLEGDRATAMSYYDKANGAGTDVGYNKGIVNIKNGDYEDAVSNFGGSQSFNAALAQLLNGDPDKALSTLEASDEANTAEGYYLKAIIGARKNNKEMVMNNLKSAVGKDASLKAKAKKDVEFLKFDLSSI